MPPPPEVVSTGTVSRDLSVSLSAMRWRPHGRDDGRAAADAPLDAAPKTLAQEMRAFTRMVAAHSRKPLHDPERPADTVRIHEYKALLFARLALEEPTEEHRELARTARYHLAEARERYAATAQADPTDPAPVEEVRHAG